MSIRMINGELEKGAEEEVVGFLPQIKQTTGDNTCNSYCDLLSREDLLNLDKKEPKWRRWRIFLLVLFWFIWIGLLAASIIVIVLSPRCPAVPDLTFWQSKIGYWIDPFAFRDSNADHVGDFQGLIAGSDYVKGIVGAGFIILDRFVQGQYSNNKELLGLTSDFQQPDEALGNMDDFRALVKAYHRIGVEVVVSFDFNSVPTSSSLVSAFGKPAIDNLSYNRLGGMSSVTIGSSSYYTSFGSEFVDLDLSKENLKVELKNILSTWFAEGIDGVLLTNAAFYFEGEANSSLFLTDSAATNNWFKNDPSKQIFQHASFEFVQEMREFVDEISKKSGKPKLLMVDPGNTGYGIGEVDYSVKFLGTKEKPGAHLVVTRQFVHNRGWKSNPNGVNFANSVEMYQDGSHESEGRLALTTATPSDRHVGDMVSLASTFLLPGSTLIYYGAELGQEFHVIDASNLVTYPKTKKPIVNINKFDSEWICHLPMLWDRDGLGFSSTSTAFPDLLDKLSVHETVETATAAGRGTSPLQMVQSLGKLHKAPSFQWGKLERVLTQSTKDVEIFVRKAEGYPAFVNVLIRKTAGFKDVIRFPAYCKNLRLRFAYPLLPNLELDKELDGNSVFIKFEKGPAVYVFECNDL